MARLAAVILVLVLGLAGSALGAGDGPALRACFAPGTVKADDLLEWEVSEPDPAWLVTDVSATPRLDIIEPPDGTVTRTRRAFLDRAHRFDPAHQGAAPEFLPDGEARLRFRHTARKAGTFGWVFRTPQGREISRGSFLVAPAAGPIGPLRISRDNPRMLAFPDGNIFVAIGPNIAWANGPDRLAGFTRYFTALKEAGGTHARVWMASWCGQIEGTAPDAYRLDHAWLFDRILALARGNGLRLTVVIDNHHDLLHGKNVPYGEPKADPTVALASRLDAFLAVPVPDQYRRKLAYLMARWGADDTIAAWELCNEVDMAQPIREKALPWVKAAAIAIKEADGDDRLHSISWAGTDWDRVMGLPGLDLVQMHGYVMEWADPLGLYRVGTRDGVQMLVAYAERANKLKRPFCFSEVGFQGTNEHNPGNDRDRTGLLLRQQAWAGLMLGGYGPAMNWWWDNYIDARGLWPVYRGLAAVAARVNWRDRELAPLQPGKDGPVRVLGWQSPGQALIWPQLRLDTWHRHLEEGKDRPTLGVPVTVRLGGMKKKAKFTCRWFDMVGGDERSHATATTDASGNLDLVVPPRIIDQVCLISDG